MQQPADLTSLVRLALRAHRLEAERAYRARMAQQQRQSPTNNETRKDDHEG
jgi:hypothetical protein